MDTNTNLLTIEDLEQKVKLKKSSIYNFIRTKNFPCGKKICGGNKSVWLQNEVDEWLLENVH